MLQEWIWPSVLCKLAPFATTLNINISVLTLVAISLDRFYIILYPLKMKLKKRHCIVIIIFIWTVSIVISGFNVFKYQVKTFYRDTEQLVNESSSSPADTNHSNLIRKCDCDESAYSKFHLFTVFTVQFIIPFTVLVFTFIAIFYKIFLSKIENPLVSLSSFTENNKRKVIILPHVNLYSNIRLI